MDFLRRTLGLARLGQGVAGKLRVVVTIGALWVAKTLDRDRALKVSITLRVPRPVTFHLDEYMDLFVLQEIFLFGEYVPDEDLQPSVVVDLGGNIGASAVFFAQRWPEAEIHVVEPDPRVLPKLGKTLRPFDKVTVHGLAIGDTDGELDFELAADSWGSHVVAAGTAGAVKVPSRRLSTFFDEQGLSRVGMLKFDIEGAELAALADRVAMERVDAIIGEIHTEMLGLDVGSFRETTLPTWRFACLRETPVMAIVAARPA